MTDRRVQIPEMGDIRVSFYGSSKEIHDFFQDSHEFSRQKRIRHLGLISDVIECATHTRYEYLMLQCASVQLLSNVHKGDTEAGVGSINIDGRAIDGSDLIKCWFLLSGYGHLMNTIADERVLCFLGENDPNFRRFLLRDLSDAGLLSYAQRVLSSFSYVDLHYILAARRILSDRRLPKNTKSWWLLILKLLLSENIDPKICDPVKLSHLKKLHNKVRKLCIISLDSRFSHLPLSFNITGSILALVETEQYHIQRSINESIDPILQWLHDEIYYDRNVVASTCSYQQIATSKYYSEPWKPSDWFQNAIDHGCLGGKSNTHLDKWRTFSYTHFARIPLLKLAKLPEAQQKMSDRFKSPEDVLTNIEDESTGNQRFLDICLPKSGLNSHEYAELFFKLAKYIGRLGYRYTLDRLTRKGRPITRIARKAIRHGANKEQMENAIKTELNPELNAAMADLKHSEMLVAVRSMFWGILDTLFNTDDFKIVLEPHVNRPMQYGLLAPKDQNMELVAENALTLADEIANESTDEDRAHEIKFLKHFMSGRKDDYVFACFNSIHILDRTERPDRSNKAQLDGVIVRVGPERTKIEIYEAKNVSRRKGKAYREGRNQLRKNVVSTFRKTRPNYSIKTKNGWGLRLELTFK